MSCNFIFCLHNHQPVGNFDHIFKWAYENCYNQIIKILREYPNFRFAVHHSGPLLEWIKHNSPEYITNLKEMCQKGQVEIIGGGFYEPIFSVISEKDIKSQIGLMQDFCEKEFCKKPKGFWTAERVWDPEIPRLVEGYDLDYTILDDIHFLYAGIDENDLHGYFITERLDKKLFVFPIDKFLRYSIPFKLPAETINYFREKTGRLKNQAFVYGDDGEKFGLWPDTYKWVFDERWLRNFIEAVLKEDWIKMTHPSEYIAENSPNGRAYLTQGSYFELSEWALPPKAGLELTRINNEIKSWNREREFYPFIKGGVWNNFLIKYPESNAINKRTILLSGEISGFESTTGIDCTPEKTDLYKSECNCAYWHGLFGGIYLTHLRHALYEYMLKAEGTFLNRKNDNSVSVIEKDIWNEGKNQILVRNKDQSSVIIPYLGGALSELGIYKHAFNIFNTITRRREAYHEKLKQINDNENNQNQSIVSIHDRIAVKEKNLKRYLIYDNTRRYSFKDILLKEIPKPEDFIFGNPDITECGGLEYECATSENNNNVVISLSRIAEFRNENIHINKNYTITNGITGIKAEYMVGGTAKFYFGVELNINLLGSHDDERYYEIPGLSKDDSYMDGPGFCGNINSFALVDKSAGFKIRISSTTNYSLLRYPVYTVSQSDSGFEKNYQGSCLLLIYGMSKGENRFSADLKIDKI